MSGRPWLEALKAATRERGANTDETPERTSHALSSEGYERCESPAAEPSLLDDLSAGEKVRCSWGEEERKLITAGWKLKERGGLIIWANPETGFYCSQEVALYCLETREAGASGTFATQKSAHVMDSGEGVSDGRDGCR